MQVALSETAYIGLYTNLIFLREVMENPAFKAGETHTDFIEKHFGGWEPPALTVPPEALIAAALIDMRAADWSATTIHSHGDLFSPWDQRDGFRLGDSSQ
jgi:acetyl/propionyl-CoA carboxylase alpha subunit